MVINLEQKKIHFDLRFILTYKIDDGVLSVEFLIIDFPFRGGGGISHHISFIGMCCCERYYF